MNCIFDKPNRPRNRHVMMRVPGGYQTMHKYLYEQANGPVPDGLELDHTCKVKACINLEHLEPVTHKVNIRRSSKLSNNTVEQIKLLYNTEEHTHRSLADLFKVSRRTIGAVLTERTWSH